MDCTNNELSSLPEALTQLTGLEDINLEGNQLTTLPITLDKLTRLKKLNLTDNQFTQLPDSFAKLNQLEELKCTSNKLHMLPNSFNKLTALKVLDLGDNNFTSMPKELVKLAKLEKLNLEINKLTILPDNLAQLTQLKTFDCTFNNLTELPASLGKVSHLKNLYLGNNDLTTIPIKLKTLTQLETLTLGNNKIITLPDIFGNLPQLENINIESNPIAHIPKGIYSANQSIHLNISNTPLSKKLGKSRVLELRKQDPKPYNLFKEALETWENTSESGEDRASAADVIFAAYHNQSSELNLNNCGLKSLPNVLHHLNQIKTIDLENNQFTDLTIDVVDFPSLDKIILDGNPINHFPKSLFAINSPLTVSLGGTPILNNIFTPPLKNKLNECDWSFYGELQDNSSTLFNNIRLDYIEKIQCANDIKIHPDDYEKPSI